MPSEISEKCKKIRAFLGVSQIKLGRILGSNDPAGKLVNRWENNTYKSISEHYAGKIDQIFHIVEHLKSHPGLQLTCSFCGVTIAISTTKLNKEKTQLLCRKCFYTFYP